jgi:hypothetical protein
LVQKSEEAFICATELGFCSSLGHVVYAHGHIALHRVARGFGQSIGSIGLGSFWHSAWFECLLVLCFLQTSINSWWAHNNRNSLDSDFSDDTKFSQYFSTGRLVVGALHHMVKYCSVPKLLDIGSK